MNIPDIVLSICSFLRYENVHHINKCFNKWAKRSSIAIWTPTRENDPEYRFFHYKGKLNENINLDRIVNVFFKHENVNLNDLGKLQYLKNTSCFSTNDVYFCDMTGRIFEHPNKYYDRVIFPTYIFNLHKIKYLVLNCYIVTNIEDFMNLTELVRLDIKTQTTCDFSPLKKLKLLNLYARNFDDLNLSNTNINCANIVNVNSDSPTHIDGGIFPIKIRYIYMRHLTLNFKSNLSNLSNLFKFECGNYSCNQNITFTNEIYKLKQLEYLKIYNCNVFCDKIDLNKCMPKLYKADITHCQIHFDNVIGFLAHMNRMSRLNISNTYYMVIDKKYYVRGKMIKHRKIYQNR